MFYSHESKLVSTIGLKSNNRKISRRAIQEVNVRKACEMIQQPKAPIALRLQGSLLYGVSKVYEEQCRYVLADAEKVQALMMTFYSAYRNRTNSLDPQAGKARRNQLVLEDDPEFDVNMQLPAFDLDDDDCILGFPKGSQASRKTSSQLSPLIRDIFSSGGGGSGSIIDAFDLSQLLSNHGAGSQISRSSYATPLPATQLQLPSTIPKDHEDEDQLPVNEDWGVDLYFGEHTDTRIEEPELPTLPRPIFGYDGADDMLSQDEAIPVIDEQGDVVMGFSDAPLPEPRSTLQQEEPQLADENIVVGSDRVVMPLGSRRRRLMMAPDSNTKLNKAEMKGWEKGYLRTMAEQARHKARHGTTVADAKKNAFCLIFGCGIANIGFPTGIPGYIHPLAEHFAGVGLEVQLLGTPIDEYHENPRGQRRSALEALELREDDERRVRRRISGEDDPQQQQQQQQQQQAGQGPSPLQQLDDALLPFGDEQEPEIGREAGQALPDLPFDIPWNRPLSQVPSSSVKGTGLFHVGSGQPGSRHVSASPLQGRGSRLPEIERFSDQSAFSSDGLGPMSHLDNSYSDPIAEGGGLGPFSGAAATTEAYTSQPMRHALDKEGRNFLGYVDAVARDKGQARDEDGRQWVDFADLFEPADRKKVVVAQAFYNVLSLVTKNIVKVEQDGQNTEEPFGTIRVGLDLLPIREQTPESNDSMMMAA
ncbi:Rec8 like protein-domain-containing protein [Bombardia bombarda]|uniref:Rec8 like protein-domain-containing protein n=1 Tax=Bombardia bombarda TaxID=252184 RepID=A0AA39WCL7_9PEZI|nr:Rec8 like protein-domain-containing protein [Bombardia bombarda]